MPRLSTLAALALCAACVESAPVAPIEDAGNTGARDAGGTRDGGRNVDDGGSLPLADGGGDAGERDAGEPDAGGEDAGTVDAGEVDAGPRPFPWTFGPETPPAEWFTNTPSCAPNDWLAKYFVYRRRLRGDGTAANPGFVSIGSGPGQSLVAGMRMPTGGCGNHWLMSSCRRTPITNADGFYLWGDSTVWLGWYLQTLATEHAAFRKLGIDTTETESDIAFALAAFHRLDESAETVFGRTPVRDGFFRRDDVFPEFVWADSAHSQPRFPRADNGLAAYGCIVSGGSCGTVTTKDGYFMSQDQVIEMLPGLALVAKLVPSGTAVNGVDLPREAKVIVDRMVRFLRDHEWKIIDPNGEMPPNEWGGSALPYSFQIAKAANRIVGSELGISDYQNTRSLTLGASIWAGAELSYPAQTLNNQAMILALASVTDEWSVEKLVSRASGWGSPIYAMQNGVLYDRTLLPTGVSSSEIESMLATAPCGGPCYATPGCTETPGWMGEHRFKSPEDRNGDVYGYVGEYTGLDYMLLHNLYVLAQDGKAQIAWEPPPRCIGTPPLVQWQSTGVSVGETYDPWNDCNRRDFGTEFCGRTFAGWLDAAYRGTARIFVKGGELKCTGREPCVVVAAGPDGSDLDDLYIGNDGADVFDAGAGNDCLYGLGGNDQLKGEGGRDELHGGEGSDTLCGEHCFVTDVNGDPDQLYGEGGDDDLQGGPGIDGLFGGDGNDRARGDLGDDTIFGDDGDDDLDGEMGDDQVFGGEGNDLVRGGNGEDKLHGGPGRDRLDGALGDDHLRGGPGDDFLMGGEGKDSLSGDDGGDRLCGGCGEDFLHGGWDSGHDSCRGEAAGLFGCLTNTSNTVEQCESSASDTDCRDAAFNAW